MLFFFRSVVLGYIFIYRPIAHDGNEDDDDECNRNFQVNKREEKSQIKSILNQYSLIQVAIGRQQPAYKQRECLYGLLETHPLYSNQTALNVL